MSTVTAQWPMPALLTSLAHADVPELAGRAGHGPLAILKALTACLPHGSAEGTVTAEQVAQVAGYSTDHTRRCLHKLEAWGLVAWSRGWRGHAGRMRIIKTAIVALIRAGKRVARQVGEWVQARRESTEIPDITSGPTPYREVTPAVDSPGVAASPATHHPTPKVPRPNRLRRLLMGKHGKPTNVVEFPVKYDGSRRRAATARAVASPTPQGDPRPCDICHKPEHACRLASLKVAPDLRHDYSPASSGRWLA